MYTLYSLNFAIESHIGYSSHQFRNLIFSACSVITENNSYVRQISSLLYSNIAQPHIRSKLSFRTNSKVKRLEQINNFAHYVYLPLTLLGFELWPVASLKITWNFHRFYVRSGAISLFDSIVIGAVYYILGKNMLIQWCKASSTRTHVHQSDVPKSRRRTVFRNQMQVSMIKMLFLEIRMYM